MSTSAATAGPLGHLIERTLPQSARGVLLDVLALHFLSAELDRDLTRGLEAGPISPGTCAEAHRRTGVLRIDVARSTSSCASVSALRARSASPLIGFALRAARTPAYLAGFGTLRGFLERGFQALSRLDNVLPLLNTIRARQSALNDALARADTSLLC
ncbi:MAG: FFLEELY motif protein [Steroidobacteraceae bacterium]